MAARGDRVDVICLSNPNDGLHGGVNVIGLPLKQYRGSKSLAYMRAYCCFFLRAMLTASRLSVKNHYDVVIVCSMPDAAVLCALPARILGAKVILDIHDTMPELYEDKFPGRRGRIGSRLLRFEERSSTWLAHRVLAVHEPHRQRLEFARVNPRKLRVLVNVPDPKLFSHISESTREDQAFTIVCHGTIAPRLGLGTAIEAMSLLRTTIPVARLHVIGRGDGLEAAKQQVVRRNLQDRVSFMPPVPLEQLSTALANATIGLIPNEPSKATHLMLPVKLLEYAALGIPTVAARLRTIEHYFGDGAVHFFNPGDAGDLARAIHELYLEPDRRNRLAARAHIALDEIGWEQQKLNLYAAVDSLLAPGPARNHSTQTAAGK